jgi:hypothetical protein
MMDIEKVELNRHKKQIRKDVLNLIEKYRKIFDWDVPENDEVVSDKLILSEIRKVLHEVDEK